jgi:hypothetical protein
MILFIVLSSTLTGEKIEGREFIGLSGGGNCGGNIRFADSSGFILIG